MHGLQKPAEVPVLGSALTFSNMLSFTSTPKSMTTEDSEQKGQAMRTGMPAVSIVGVLTGCTHTRLRHNTVNQAQTLSEVYQHQVLNNLARFVYDSNALPDFAVPNAGASDVQDSANIGFAVNWIRSGFDSTALNGGATRGMAESWTLTPVTDPRKLELMCCAYQRAVASCCPTSESAGCPDCLKCWA